MNSKDVSLSLLAPIFVRSKLKELMSSEAKDLEKAILLLSVTCNVQFLTPTPFLTCTCKM